jgi:toxin ParE1/3/4
MYEVILTPYAEEDILQILDYLTREASEESVKKFLSLFEKKCLTLAEFPEMGRNRHELLINLKSFPIQKYTLFYIQIKNGIEILRVLHNSRDIEQVFEEMLPLQP